jgi:hypothetical protein
MEIRRVRSGLGPLRGLRHGDLAERKGDVAQQRQAEGHRLAYLQTWASVIALVLGVPGLWLAQSAFRDQHAVNRSQLAASAQETQRYQRRYASRVIWLDFAGGH